MTFFEGGPSVPIYDWNVVLPPNVKLLLIFIAGINYTFI